MLAELERQKELKLFGLDDLVKKDNVWDLTLSQFLEASYAHYKENGIGNGPMLSSVKDLFDGKGTTTSGSYLPVCDTHFRSDVKDRMPCMCGDDNGSETKAFWKEAHFTDWMGETDRSHPLHKAKTWCTEALYKDTTMPVQFFKNLCNMDIHWPIRLETAHSWVEGKDHLCEEFNNATESFNTLPEYHELQQQLDLNCHMCFHDPVGENIMYAQRNPQWHSDSNKPYTFEGACDIMMEEMGVKEEFGGLWDPARC